MSATPRRVISLLPGATEMVAALGLEEQLVAISHGCDYPATVTGLPRITATPIDPAADSQAIDSAVRAAVAEGRAVIGVDLELLRALDPDVVLTQALCDVCAVSDGAVHRLAGRLDRPPHIVSLHGRTLEGVFADIVTVATALGVAVRGEELVARLQRRLATLRTRFHRDRPVPVVVIEWLDPCFLAGHWTPEIVAAAGGRDIASRPGEHSVARDWNDVVTLDPDVVVIALCGFGVDRAHGELARLDRPAVRAWLDARRVEVIDGNAYTSRAGPRLLDAVEILGGVLAG